MSAMDGADSENLSVGISEKVVAATVPHYQALPKTQQMKILDTANFTVRKTAHAAEYAFLGVLALLVLLSYKKPLLSQALISLMICAVYAASDEIHQIFTFGRTPLFTDSLIDICGSTAGILILVAIAKRKKRNKPLFDMQKI
jgi:Predicted integral membrane protein